MKKLLGLLALVTIGVCGAGSAQAQGSPYNLFGFGTPIPSRNPAIEALGGAGVALEGNRTVNEINPADWTWINRARFETSLRFEYFSYTQGALNGSQHNVNFNGFTFGAPIWSEYKAAIGIGYVPITNASYEFQSSDSTASTTSRSRGGVNMGFIGISAQPMRGISLGARLDLILGNIRHENLVEFVNTESQSGISERDYFFNGLRPTLGLELIGDSLGSGFGGLTLGASISLPATLKSTRETIITPLSSALDTTIADGGNGRYPGSLTVGASYKLSNRFRVEGDYMMQDFTTAFVYSPSGSVTDPTLRNGSRVSFGVERVANISNEYGTSFGLDRWALRLGFYYSQLPILPTGSGGVNEMAVTAGLGIPLGFETLFNLSVTGGQRAPANAGSAPKETFLRLGANVSLSERWFVPTPRE